MMRLSYPQLAPASFRSLATLKHDLEAGSVGPAIHELMATRISQMNGCRHCISVHTRALLGTGETRERVEALAGWRESALFSEKERSALAFAEAVTDVQTAGVPDATYEPLTAHFEDRAIVELTLMIAMVNAFNRISIAFAA